MKRAIAGKRGSVRGAPPDVYASFTTFGDDDPESIRESIKPAIDYFSGMAIILTLVIVGTFLAILFCIFFRMDEDGVFR